MRPSSLTPIILVCSLLFGVQASVAEDAALQPMRDAWQHGDLKQALVQLKNRISDQPNDVDALLLLAAVYLDLVQGAEAEQTLLQAQSAGMPRERIVLPLLRALLMQGKHLQVLDETAIASFSDPERRAELDALRGMAYLGLRDNSAAEAAFGQALALIPGQLDGLLGQTRLALAEGRTADARALLSQATRIHPESAEAWEQLAALDFASEDYEAAERSLVAAGVAARNKWIPRFKRALVRLELGEIEAAKADIEAIEKDFPNFPALHFARGVLMLKQGLVHQGIESIYEYLRYEPTNPDATLVLAKAEIARNNPGAGGALLRQYLRSVPGSVDANLTLARLLFERGDAAEAERQLLPLAESGAASAKLLALLAQTATAQGRAADARRWLEQAIELDPNNAGYRVDRADNAMVLGDVDAALAALQKALELNPLNRTAALMEIKVLLANGRGAQGLALAEELALRRRDDAVVLNALGLARLGAEDTPGAQVAFEQALAVEPGYVEAAMNLFNLRLRAGEQEAASAVLERVLTAAPGSPEAIMALAALDGRIGGPRARMRRLESAVDSYPMALELRLALARDLLAAGEPQRSRALLQSAPEQLRTAPPLLTLVGESLLALDEHDEAIETFQTLVLLTPNSAAPHYFLARAYVAAGQLGAAEESMERGLAMEPGHRLLPTTMKVLLSAVTDADARLVLLDRIIAQTGDQFAPLEVKGDMLAAMGELSQARALFQTLHERAPDEPLVMRKLVAMEHAGRNGGRIVEILESWLSRHPDDVDARLMLAQAYTEQDQTPAALELLSALVQDQPGNALVLSNLARLLRDSDAERALTYAERAHRLKPAEALIMDTLGTLLVRKGELERGLELLDEARIADPTTPSIALHYAEALTEAGRSAEARLILLGLVDRSFAEQTEARELLEEIDR